MGANRKTIQVKPTVTSPRGSTGGKPRSDEDTGKRSQQAEESDGPVLVEAMHNPLKRGKLDYRNWLQVSRKNLQEPGGWKMSAIWRNWRKENWKSCRSGVGTQAERKAILQGCLGWGLMSSQCSKSRMQPSVWELGESAIQESHFLFTSRYIYILNLTFRKTVFKYVNVVLHMWSLKKKSIKSPKSLTTNLQSTINLSFSRVKGKDFLVLLTLLALKLKVASWT